MAARTDISANLVFLDALVWMKTVATELKEPITAPSKAEINGTHASDDIAYLF